MESLLLMEHDNSSIWNMLIMTNFVGATQNYEADRQPVRFLFKTPTQIDSGAPDYVLLSQGYLTQAFFIHVKYKRVVVD